MRYFFTFSRSASGTCPSRTYTAAAATAGRSPPVMSWMHWAAESARWSYCPGSASTAVRAWGPSTGGMVSSQIAST